MKRLFVSILLVVALLFLVSCDDTQPTLKVSQSTVDLFVGDTYDLKPTVSGLKEFELIYSVDKEGIIEISDGKITALAGGTVVVTISIKDRDDIKSVQVTINVSNKQDGSPHLEIDEDEIELYIGETYQLNPIVRNLEDYIISYSVSNEDIIAVTNGKITALKEGTTTVTISILNRNDITPINVTVKVKKPGGIIEIVNDNIELEVGQEYQLNPIVKNIDEYELVYNVDNDEIIEIVNGKITALKEGTVSITISIKDRDDVVPVVITVIVSRNSSVSIKIVGPEIIYRNQTVTLKVELKGISGEVIWSSNDTQIVRLTSDGAVTGLNPGTVIITAACNGYTATHELSVLGIEDTVSPTFTLEEDFKQREIVNWNKTFDVLKGIKAFDNADGDITDKIRVTKGFDNQAYGIQVVELEVEDSSGNVTKMTREVEVVWNYDVTFIGHAGSYYGLMNSEEAILYAIQVLKYQAVEVDLKQTKDGVFVLCHDDTFAGYTLASTNWSVLKDVEHTATRYSGFPAQNGSAKNTPYTTKLCTLERFLEICKEYNVKAVIELKYSAGINSNDQSRMPALMDVIERTGMRENVILLTSQLNCLIWTRNNGYSDIECQYLVTSLENEATLQRCIQYNLDISFNITGQNSDEWIARYKEAGLKVSCYTFTQYDDYPKLQSWINKGVDFVTCDWHRMDKVVLPEKSDLPLPTYQVTFTDYDGTVLKVSEVKEGKTAAAPATPTRNGYTFIGWDKDFNNVKQDMVVVAQYRVNNYTITYEANVDEIVESSWPSKQAFIDEFYTDLYNWLLTNGKNIKEITVQGNKVTMTKNGVTVSFDSVEGLKNIDKYDFEKTISNIIYKPVVRASDDSAIIEESEDYFLNSKLYRIKYLDLDRYFINCINKWYPSYDKTYTPLPDGRIQIFFRFHQWQQGTDIGPFNSLPKKYILQENPNYTYQLPTDKTTYTIEDEFDLPPATGNHQFLGWYLDRECTIPITKITKGMTGNIIVYAKWGDLI